MGTRPHEVFIGVDAGGTQTRAVCISGRGEILGWGTAGPANHASGALAKARASIGEAIERAGASIGAGNPIHAVGTFIGSAGLEHEGAEADGRVLLDQRVVSDAVFLDSDAYVAWAGAFRCRPGIVVIAGTGSMCLGIDAQGTRVKVGGWGWRVGDEGSAYGIAIDAIRVALQTVDGRRDAPLLWATLEEFAGSEIATTSGIGRGSVGAVGVRAWLYAGGRRPTDIAAFAPYVERAAADGCAASHAILEHAGAELAAMVRAVAGKLSDGPLPIAVMGGVLRRNAIVRGVFLREARGDPGIGPSTEPAYAPEIGAALLALRARHPVNAELFTRLDAAGAKTPARG